MREPGPRRGRLLWLALLPLLLALGACANANLDARLAYLQQETARGLPLGSSLSEAQAFFSARGATLLCCVRMPPQAERHYVLERRLGQGFMREYDVAVLVEFSPAGRVASLSVQRWGVGW